MNSQPEMDFFSGTLCCPVPKALTAFSTEGTGWLGPPPRNRGWAWLPHPEIRILSGPRNDRNR
jgi:hypothetical protein